MAPVEELSIQKLRSGNRKTAMSRLCVIVAKSTRPEENKREKQQVLLAGPAFHAEASAQLTRGLKLRLGSWQLGTVPSRVGYLLI